MTIKELLTKRDELAEQADAAYDEGDEERGDELFDEVKSLNTKIERKRELADARTKHTDYEPVRPNLPGGNGHGPAVDDDDDDDVSVQDQVFIKKYGTPEKEVKAILKDVYGSVGTWQEQRWNQLKAFNRYLRQPRWTPTGDEADALRNTILSHQDVTRAVSKGVLVKDIKATMVEADDTLGGYAVPADFREEVITRIAAMARVRPLVTTRTTSRDVMRHVKVTGGDDQFIGNVRLTWVDETPSSGAAETNMTFGTENIPVFTAMATVPLSRNLVEDSAFDIVGMLTEELSTAFAIGEDNQFVNGDGVGKPKGLLQNGSNGESLTEVKTGNASALQWFSDTQGEGLLGMTYAIAEQYRDNGQWLFNRSTAESIARLQDGESRAYWTEEQQGSDELMRFPYLLHEGVPDIAASAYPVIFGDFSGYTIADRVGMTIERYLDSSTAEQNIVKYIARRRVGGKVTQPYKLAVQLVST